MTRRKIKCHQIIYLTPEIEAMTPPNADAQTWMEQHRDKFIITENAQGRETWAPKTLT